MQFCEGVANTGKTVIVAALDGDFTRSGFNDILNLVPLAESVVKLNAVCMMCFETASFTKRISNETSLEVIGGADKYIAACRKCHPKTAPNQRSALKTSKVLNCAKSSNCAEKSKFDEMSERGSVNHLKENILP